MTAQTTHPKLLPELLLADINNALNARGSRVTCDQLKQVGAPFEEAMEVSYCNEYGQWGLLIGTLLTKEEHNSYNRRHAWASTIAEAIIVSEEATRE